MKVITFRKTGLYTITEYAKLKGVNRRTIYNWVKNGNSDIEIVGKANKQLVKLSNEELYLLFPGCMPGYEVAADKMPISELVSICSYYKLIDTEESREKFAYYSQLVESRIKQTEGAGS